MTITLIINVVTKLSKGETNYYSYLRQKIVSVFCTILKIISKLNIAIGTLFSEDFSPFLDLKIKTNIVNWPNI